MISWCFLPHISFISFFCFVYFFLVLGQKCQISTCLKMEKKRRVCHFVSSDQPAKFGEFCNMIRGTKWGSDTHSFLQFRLGLWHWHNFWFYHWTQSLIIILIKLKSHRDKCHGYGSILYLGCFLVTHKMAKTGMDEADKNVSTSYKHLTNHSWLYHIFTGRRESQCCGLRSTRSKFKMMVVENNPPSC